MIRIRDLPIRQRLLGAVAMAVLPALLLSCVASLSYEKHLRRSAVERELLATARIVGSSTVLAMRVGDRKGAEAVLGALAANPGIRRAVLRDDRSQVLASYVQGSGGRSAKSFRSASAQDPDQAAIGVTQEIRFEGQPLGTVRLEAGLDDLHRDSTSFLVATAVICAGSALLILLLMLQLQRAVTEPTLDLLRGLQREKDRAESASRAKSEFLAGMSHEMRTPLHAILSFAELGGGRAASLTPEKATRYYKMIEEGGRRLLDLLNDLVDLANFEAGKRVLRFASAPVDAVVLRVVDEVRPLFQSRGIGLEAGPCGPMSGWMDREALTQVVRHVLTNAARWSGPGATVTVTLGRSERGPLLSVTTRGSGVAHAGQEVRSSGLKLALCREIMAAHGGKIWSEARDGAGENTYLEIPDPISLQNEGEPPRSAAAA